MSKRPLPKLSECDDIDHEFLAPDPPPTPNQRGNVPLFPIFTKNYKSTPSQATPALPFKNSHPKKSFEYPTPSSQTPRTTNSNSTTSSASARIQLYTPPSTFNSYKAQQKSVPQAPPPRKKTRILVKQSNPHYATEWLLTSSKVGTVTVSMIMNSIVRDEVSDSLILRGSNVSINWCEVFGIFFTSISTTCSSLQCSIVTIGTIVDQPSAEYPRWLLQVKDSSVKEHMLVEYWNDVSCLEELKSGCMYKMYGRPVFNSNAFHMFKCFWVLPANPEEYQQSKKQLVLLQSTMREQ